MKPGIGQKRRAKGERKLRRKNPDRALLIGMEVGKLDSDAKCMRELRKLKRMETRAKHPKRKNGGIDKREFTRLLHLRHATAASATFRDLHRWFGRFESD